MSLNLITPLSLRGCNYLSMSTRCRYSSSLLVKGSMVDGRLQPLRSFLQQDMSHQHLLVDNYISLIIMTYVYVYWFITMGL